MNPVLRHLHHGAGGAAWNMAVDEALLRCVTRPVLRCYGWNEPAVTLGYFQAPDVAPAGRPFVRRYTGGGLVDHARDFTYTVVLPRAHPLAGVGAAQSYCDLHRAVQRALAASGVRSDLTPSEQDGVDGLCFQKPVKHDIVSPAGAKVAGAAQRRTRDGVLHQGSILLDAYPDGLEPALVAEIAAVLGLDALPDSLTEEELRLAGELESARYATAAWNRQFEREGRRLSPRPA
jgi:lipoate-protein ligase A